MIVTSIVGDGTFFNPYRSVLDDDELKDIPHANYMSVSTGICVCDTYQKLDKDKIDKINARQDSEVAEAKRVSTKLQEKLAGKFPVSSNENSDAVALRIVKSIEPKYKETKHDSR